MSLLIGMALPALILSCLIGCSLPLAVKAPPRARFWIAMTGLLAWVVPWPFFRAITPAAAPEFIGFAGIPEERIIALTNNLSDRLLAHSNGMGSLFEKLPDYWIIVLFL